MASKAGKIKIVRTSGDLDFFDPNLIATDCVDAGIDFWTAAEVAIEVSERIYHGISTEEIQKVTLDVLSKKNPEAAERYRRFHSMYVRTSRNTIDAFDRKKIEESLLEETTLPREIASNIARETEMELRRLKLDFISAPLIREMVNVKLLSHGFEEARGDYTRLGMPVSDAGKLVKSSKDYREIRDRISMHVLKEYTLLKVLPLPFADSHMYGDVHIHSLESFAISTGDVYLHPEAQEAEDAYSSLAILLQSLRNYRRLSSGDIFLPHFTSFFHLNGQGGMLRFWKFFLAEARELGLKLSISSSDKFFGQIASIYREAGFELPKLTVVLGEGGWEGLLESPQLSRITFWNTSSSFFRGSESTELFGLLAELGAEKPLSSALRVTINLPRIAYLAGGEERKFFKKLHQTLSMSREIVARKKEVVKRRVVPELDAEFSYELGFLGLNEMSRAFTGDGIGESHSSLNFALRVLTAMKSTLEDWSRLSGEIWLLVPVEELEVASRLAKLDYGLFPSKAVVRGDRGTGRVYYTPGFTTPGKGRKISLHAELQSRVHSASPLLVGAESYSALADAFASLQKSGLPAWRFNPGC